MTEVPAAVEPAAAVATASATESATVERERPVLANGPVAASSRVGKNPGFFKKTQPSGFFWVFLVFFGFFGFFCFFLRFFCLDERVFRVFFSFTNTFRCIQTFNYNHSY